MGSVVSERVWGHGQISVTGWMIASNSCNPLEGLGLDLTITEIYIVDKYYVYCVVISLQVTDKLRSLWNTAVKCVCVWLCSLPQGVLPGVCFPRVAFPVAGDAGLEQLELVPRQHHAAHARSAEPAGPVGRLLDAALARCSPRAQGLGCKCHGFDLRAQGTGCSRQSSGLPGLQAVLQIQPLPLVVVHG